MGVMDWIYLNEEGEKWWAFVDEVMNLQVK